MLIALVNTNLYRSPPVIPVGLEYVAGSLEAAGHEVRALDLTFSSDPLGEMLEFLDGGDFGMVGFSVRNVDTALYQESEFFLPEAARLVSAAREVSRAFTVAGGGSTMAGPQAVRRFLGVDCVVSGPGELAARRIAERIEGGAAPPEVVDGWSLGVDPSFTPARGVLLDYSPYLADGHPAGLEFRKGCDWACPFCLERCRPVLAREPEVVVKEADTLSEAGVETAFFCDSELNLDTAGTRSMLEALAAAETGITWTAYLRPKPFDRKIARLAAASGCGSVTLSVNSWDISRADSPYGADDVRSFCRLCEEVGIEVAVDLLAGYPGEPESSVREAVDSLAGTCAASVGVNPYIRLYETTPAGDLLREKPEPAKTLGAVNGNPGMLRPVFYRGLEEARIEEMTIGLGVFFVEGKSRRVNYQRLRGEGAGEEGST